MAQMAIAESRTKQVRLLSIRETNGLPQKDFLGEVVCLTQYVRDQIRYVRDITFCETVQSPTITLQLGAGDCDDKSTLLASMLLSLGFTVRFVVCDVGRGWCHVWTQVELGGKWIDLETTESVPVGSPSAYLKPNTKFMYWPIEPGNT